MATTPQDESAIGEVMKKAREKLSLEPMTEVSLRPARKTQPKVKIPLSPAVPPEAPPVAPEDNRTDEEIQRQLIAAGYSGNILGVKKGE